MVESVQLLLICESIYEGKGIVQLPLHRAYTEDTADEKHHGSVINGQQRKPC